MKKTWLKVGAVFAGWSVLAIMWATSAHARLVLAGHLDPFWTRLFRSLLDYWIYAALTPLVFWAAWKFRFQRGRIIRAILAHTLTLAVFSELHRAASGLLAGSSATALRLGTHPLRTLWLNVDNDLWMYWPLVVIWNLIQYYSQYRERDVMAARLETQLARAQLDLLKAQIQPHFLFNTLNSIASLMHEDANVADDMIADLSYMLRQSLDLQADQEISLQHELDLLEAYVRIQKRRFEDRLSVNIDITAGIRDALVPSFLCQPLVENAIRHGIGEHARAGVVYVMGYRRDESIILQVRDNGRGLPAHYTEGIGLSNTRKRLEQLYGQRQSMKLEGNRDGGLTVTIELPFRAGTFMEDNHHDSNGHSGRRTASPAAHPLPAEN